MTARLRRLVALLVVLLSALIFGLASPAYAGPDITPCRDGGHVNYVDPATNEPFATQGRCISVVARGGALVPTAPPVTVTSWSVVYVGDCMVTAHVGGESDGYIPYTFVVDGEVVVIGEFIPPDNLAVLVTFLEPHTVELVIDDQIFRFEPDPLCGL